MGRGEYAGYFSNLRALVVATAPLMYGNIYAAVQDNPSYPPGLAYFVCAVMGCIIPELLHQSVSSKDIEPPKPIGEQIVFSWSHTTIAGAK